MSRLVEPSQLYQEFSEEHRDYSQEFTNTNTTNALSALKELVSDRIDFIIRNVPLEQTAQYLIRILTSLDAIKMDEFIGDKVKEVVSKYIERIEFHGSNYICQYYVPTHHINRKITSRYRKRETKKRNKDLEGMKGDIRGPADIIHDPHPS